MLALPLRSEPFHFQFSDSLYSCEAIDARLQAGAITGFVSAFAEGPIDFFKSQIQVQIIRAKGDINYKRGQL